MRIQYQVEGGIAYFPALSEPITIDTSELPAEDSSKLERLIEEANFFSLPANFTPPRNAADYQQYTISVTRSGRTHTVQVTSPIENPRLLALVGYLEEVRTRKLGLGNRL